MSTTRGDGRAKMRRPTYNPISDVESLENYIPGGYHPIMIGDMLRGGKYCIVDKLGFGGYSTVWLAQDTHAKCYVAVKVGTTNSSSREVAILRQLQLSAAAPVPFPACQGRDSIPCVLDEFQVKGPNGTHPCYTMPLAACDLRTASYSELFPVDVARALSGRLVLAVAYLHARGYAHGDIHLRNILICLPSQLDQLSIDQLYEEYGEPEKILVTRTDGKPLTPNVPSMAVVPHNLVSEKTAEEFTLADTRILLNDFGEAYAPAAPEPRHIGRDCHTPLGSRPPEARFEPDAPLSYPADIWGLALAIWEILGMKAMFSNEFTTLDEVTAQQVDVLGPMPSPWWDSWDERARLFGEDGRSLEDRWPTLDVALEEFVQKYRRKWPEVGIFGDDEAAAILDLMRGMLAFRPEERLTAEEVLRSEWMRKWVLPDVERSRGGVD